MLSKDWRWARGTCAERQPVTGSTGARRLCAPGSCPTFEICCRRKLIFRGMPIRSPSHTRCAAATRRAGAARANPRAGCGPLSAMRLGLAAIAAWVLCAHFRGEKRRGVVRGNNRIATMTACRMPCQGQFMSTIDQPLWRAATAPAQVGPGDSVRMRQCEASAASPPTKRGVVSP